MLCIHNSWYFFGGACSSNRCWFSTKRFQIVCECVHKHKSRYEQNKKRRRRKVNKRRRRKKSHTHTGTKPKNDCFQCKFVCKNGGMEKRGKISFWLLLLRSFISCYYQSINIIGFYNFVTLFFSFFFDEQRWLHYFFRLLLVLLRSFTRRFLCCVVGGGCLRGFSSLYIPIRVVAWERGNWNSFFLVVLPIFRL